MSASNLTPSNETDRWRAVCENDAQHDGAFFYAVRSTGIYCRPSCRSRLPRRDNVTFYNTTSEAEAAGYRPCRRCRPQTIAIDPQVEAVAKACAYIEAHDDSSPGLDAMGRHVGLSPYHLQRVFKRLMGISPRQYADAHRLACLKQHLRRGDRVTDALYDAGYGSSSRLYERAGSQLGMTPATYQRGGAGTTINYVITDAPLPGMGGLLVAHTERGVCAVHLGGDEAELVERLHSEYPLADIRRNQYGLCERIEAVLRDLRGDTPPLDLPRAIQATALQWRIWQAVVEILSSGHDRLLNPSPQSPQGGPSGRDRQPESKNGAAWCSPAGVLPVISAPYWRCASRK